VPRIPNNPAACGEPTCEHDGVPDPRTGRDRLVGHAYKDSAAFLARTGLYRYQRDAVDLRAWVLNQVQWPVDARVLDVGCGPGRYLSKLAEIVPNAQPVGMDLSSRMAAEAHEFSAVVVADAQDLPFPDATFDGLIAAHMLYHVPQIEVAVREFARVLHPEGYALVVLNGREHLQEMRRLMRLAIRDLVGTDYMLPARSTERFTIESASSKLAEALNVLRCERMKRTVELAVAQPVVEYADSMRSFYEPLLRTDIEWDALMARVRARVEETVAHEGAWRTHSDAGCFVCRPR
jgi:ubiquinone/menaquinone biosynthesis C-methylase UbiE